MRRPPINPQPSGNQPEPGATKAAPGHPSSLLLDTRAAAGMLYVSAGYMEQLRSMGGGPKFIKLPGRGKAGYIVRYTIDALEAWVKAQQEFTSTTDVDVQRLA